MQRKTIDYLIILGLGISGSYVLLTGLMMDVLYLPMIAFHNVAGYICCALALLHFLRFYQRVENFLGIQKDLDKTYSK